MKLFNKLKFMKNNFKELFCKKHNKELESTKEIVEANERFSCIDCGCTTSWFSSTMTCTACIAKKNVFSNIEDCKTECEICHCEFLKPWNLDICPPCYHKKHSIVVDRKHHLKQE